MGDFPSLPFTRPSRDRLSGLLLFLVVFVSCSYFFPGGGWNQASRFNLVRAIVEEGTLKIDRYHQNTGDKASHQGHYYCDKAPGASLFAVPFVVVTDALMTDSDGSEEQGGEKLLMEARVAYVASGALPTAFAAMALYYVGRRLGASRNASACAAIGYGLGTPAWAYGTLFWGHALSAGCLVAALWAALKVIQSRWLERQYALWFLVGATAGWAVVTEFTAAIVASMLVFVLVLYLPREALAVWWRPLGMLTLGAFGPALVLGTYNRLAFGSPFHLGYSSVVGWEGMQTGLFGITMPKSEIVIELLVGDMRGLLLCAPVLLLAPFGLLSLMARPYYRPIVMLCTVTFVYYVLINASYHYWTGGFTWGPRHVAAGLPFLCVGLLAPWGRSCIGMVLLKSLTVVSIAITLMVVSVNPMPPEVERPFSEIIWPRFLDGRLSLNAGPLLSTGITGAQNWGEIWGLRGIVSLAPLFLFWWLVSAAWQRIHCPTELATGTSTLRRGTSCP